MHRGQLLRMLLSKSNLKILYHASCAQPRSKSFREILQTFRFTASKGKRWKDTAVG